MRFGDLGSAWYVFGKMEERDLFSWNVLVGGDAKAGFFLTRHWICIMGCCGLVLSLMCTRAEPLGS